MNRALLIIACVLTPAFRPTSTLAQGFDCTKALAAAESARVLPGIEASYRKIEDLTANFVQRSYFAGLDQGENSGGKVHFKKPGMMDWEYEQPQPQRFVADGESLWFYQPELNQVTIGDFRRSFSSELPVSFLLGLGSLSDNFRLKQACVADRGLVADLEPIKEDSGLQEFKLLVEKESYSPLGARVLDLSSNETIITLQDVVVNSGFAAGRFKFVPPRGVDLIDERTFTKPEAVQQNSKPAAITESDVISGKP